MGLPRARIAGMPRALLILFALVLALPGVAHADISIEILAATGRPPPGLPDSTFNSAARSLPVINDQGHITFVLSVDNAADVLWGRQPGGDLQMLALPPEAGVGFGTAHTAFQLNVDGVVPAVGLTDDGGIVVTSAGGTGEASGLWAILPWDENDSCTNNDDCSNGDCLDGRCACSTGDQCNLGHCPAGRCQRFHPVALALEASGQPNDAFIDFPGPKVCGQHVHFVSESWLFSAQPGIPGALPRAHWNGGPVPDAPGSTFIGLTNACSSEDVVTFQSRYEVPAYVPGVWSDRDGPLAAVVLTLDGEFLDLGATLGFTQNGPGDVLLFQEYVGSEQVVNGLFISPVGTPAQSNTSGLVEVVTFGEPLPGLGQTATFTRGYSLDDDGRVTMIVVLEDATGAAQDALVVGDASHQFSAIVSGGDAMPTTADEPSPAPVLQTLHSYATGSAGHVAYLAQVGEWGDDGLYLYDPDEQLTEKIVRVGDAVEVAGGDVRTVSSISWDPEHAMGPLGRVCFQLWFDDSTESMANACVAGPPVVRVVAMEATQVVQDLQNSVPLLSGKQTLVRVFVQSEAPHTVTGTLTGTRFGDELTGSPLAPLRSIVTRSDPLQRRDKRNAALEFLLPLSWDLIDDVRFALTNQEFELRCEEHGAPGGDCAVNVALDDAPPFAARVAPVSWNTTSGTPQLVDLGTVAKEIPRLVDRLPIAPGSVGRTSPIQFGGTHPPLSEVNRLLGVMRAADGCGASCRTYYYGLMAGTTGGLQGLARGIPSFVSRGHGDAVFAHEVAHSIGRHHATHSDNPSKTIDGVQYKTGLCGAVSSTSAPDFPHRWQGKVRFSPELTSETVRSWVYGYEATGGYVVSPTYDTELMSYCWGTSYGWPSDITYKGMRETLLDPAPQTPAGPAGAYRLVSGTVDGSGATLGAMLQLDLDDPPPVPDEGDYVLEALDVDGDVVTSITFGSRSEAGSGADAGATSFLVALPAELELGGLRVSLDGAELVAATATASAPTVALTGPTGPQEAETVRVEWEASDPDGDALLHTVQVQLDDGGWKTVALEQEGASVELPRTAFPASDGAMIRVLTSDGFHVAEDLSEPLVFADNAPDATILQPSGGWLFGPGEQLRLVGTGWDPDLPDGPAVDLDVTWASNLDGALGTGTELGVAAANLTEGVHTITLTVTDAGGAVGTDAVEIEVSGDATEALADLSVAVLVPRRAEDGFDAEVVVRNEGPDVAPVTVTLELENAAGETPTLEGEAGTCSGSGGSASCTVDALADAATLRWPITPEATGEVTVAAILSATTRDPRPGQEQDLRSTWVDDAPIGDDDDDDSAGEEPEGCGCGVGASGPVGLAMLGLLLLVGRRRRA